MSEEYQMKKNEVLFILAGLRNLHPAEQKAVDYAMECVRNAPDYFLANPFGEDQRKQALKERREIAKRHGWTIGKGILEETTYVRGQDGGEWYVPIRLVEKNLNEVIAWMPLPEPYKEVQDADCD